VQTAATEALTEIKKPDSYYLVPCPDLRESNSDSLQDILDMVAMTIADYNECKDRHNNLVEQLK